MDWENQLSVLSICLPALPAGTKPDALSFCAVDSAKKALEMMRLMRFDLVLVGPGVPDATVWALIGRMKAGCYWQKWALVAEGAELSQADELKARMLGCTAILDSAPNWSELDGLVQTLRRKNVLAAARQAVPAAREHAVLVAG